MIKRFNIIRKNFDKQRVKLCTKNFKQYKNYIQIILKSKVHKHLKFIDQGNLKRMLFCVKQYYLRYMRIWRPTSGLFRLL